MRDNLMQDYVNKALEEHDFITEKLDEEFPLSELKEAKAAIREAEKRARKEAKEWLDSEWEKVKKDNGAFLGISFLGTGKNATSSWQASLKLLSYEYSQK